MLCQLSRDKFVPLEYSAHNNGSSSKQARLKLNRKDERKEAVAATCRIAVSMAQDSRDVSICPRMYAYFARYRLVHIALYGFTKKVETLGINFTFCFVYALSFASKFFIEIVDTFSGIQLLLKQISMLKYSFVTRVLVSSSLSALPPFLSPSLYDRVAVIIGTRKLIRWCFCDSLSLRSSWRKRD